MGAMTLGIALLFMLLVVDSGRLYLEKRKLQRVADTAALEVVPRGGACVSPNTNAVQFAIQSATRNDFPIDDNRTLATACGTLVTGADFIRSFSPNPSKADAIQVIATHRVVTSIANFDFYYTYGLFRLAGIVQQIYYRFFHGQTQDKRFAQFIHMNKLLEQMSLNVIKQSSL